jgi:hypothetical protein
MRVRPAPICTEDILPSGWTKPNLSVVPLHGALRSWRCAAAWLSDGRQRAGGGAWEGRGVGLGGGAAAGRGGGSEILSKIACSVVCRLVMSRLICSRPLESSSTLRRTAARPDDVASSCSLRVGERATDVGALSGTEAACLEDCQARAAATPQQNVIRSAITSEILTDDNVTRSPLFFGSMATFESFGTSVASSDGLVCQWRAENHDLLVLSTEFIVASLSG